jgi:hypothetical protein
MAELGYQEGVNFSFDFMEAASGAEYEVGYRKLAARACDVILAIGPEIALKSAVAATRTVPVVMIAIDYDPLARGYMASLARPSGNVTGVVFQQVELAAKRPLPSLACSFSGLNCANGLMTMRPRSIRHCSAQLPIGPQSTGPKTWSQPAYRESHPL